MKRSTTRMLNMAGLRARGYVSETVRGAVADLVGELARDTWLADQEFAHWPAVTVEYLVEGGFDPDGGVTFQPAPPSVAQFLRIHAAVETR